MVAHAAPALKTARGPQRPAHHARRCRLILVLAHHGAILAPTTPAVHRTMVRCMACARRPSESSWPHLLRPSTRTHTLRRPRPGKMDARIKSGHDDMGKWRLLGLGLRATPVKQLKIVLCGYGRRLGTADRLALSVGQIFDGEGLTLGAFRTLHSVQHVLSSNLSQR